MQSTCTLRIALRFLAQGGRIIVDAAGEPSFAIPVDSVLTLTLTARRRASAYRVVRAARVLAWRRPEQIVALATEHGTSLPGGWIVWEDR